MASYIYPIPEVYRSVTRPITLQMIRNMFAITGINPKQFRTNMIGLMEQEKVPGSSIDETHPRDEQRQNNLTSDMKFMVEIEEEFLNPNTTNIRQPDNYPLFIDKQLKVIIKPVRTLIKSTISVVVNAKDKVQILNWMRRIQNQIWQDGVTHYHEIDYHYPLPKVIASQLIHIHELREKVDGYDEDFGEWISKHFIKGWDVIANQKGDGKQLVIREKQVNIYGWFNFDYEPVRPEKESENAGGWECKFDYSFYYERPESMVIDFPLVIHNQLISSEYFTKERPHHLNTFARYASTSDNALFQVGLPYTQQQWQPAPGIPYPSYNDWKPINEPNGYLQISRSLIQLDPTDKRWVTNLDDLSDEFVFKKEVLDFMASSGKRIFHMNESVFHVVVYRWDNRLSGKLLQLEENMKISTTVDLKLRDMYHVCTYILSDITKISKAGLDKLLSDCKVFHEYGKAIYNNTGIEKVRCNKDGTVNKQDFHKWWENYKKENDPAGYLTGPGRTNGLREIRSTLGYYAIITHRETKQNANN